MKAHLKYLSYVIRHKWFVFLACRKCGVSLWRSFIHDWSKFLPCEWTPYVNEFYGDWKAYRDKEPDDYRYWCYRAPIEAAFAKAWNHHQKTNKHHWQWWLLTQDSDDPKHNALPMPEKYLREMVADWWGAGRAITGKWDVQTWYGKQKNKILLHERTRSEVESLIATSAYAIQNRPRIQFHPFGKLA